MKNNFLFNKTNYIILLAGIFIIALGFILMAGGKSYDPNIFNEEVISFRRIRLAPTVIFIGFGVWVYSFFYTPKKDSESQKLSRRLSSELYRDLQNFCRFHQADISLLLRKY